MKKVAILMTLLFSFTITLNAKVVARVDNMVITEKEANQVLKTLTKGKYQWSTLPGTDKKQLIQMMAPAKLVLAKARKELSRKEKEVAIAGFWMKKEILKQRISNSTVKKAYNKMVKIFKKSKSRKKIPTFTESKEGIKMQLAQDKIMSKLMKSAKVKIR